MDDQDSAVPRGPQEGHIIAGGLPVGTPRGAALWAAWAAVTTLGWAAAGACMGQWAYAGPVAVQYAFVPLSAVGQWLVLRRHFARASLWLAATLGGAAVAGLVYTLVQALPESMAGPRSSGVREGLSLVADGLALGVAQWLVLRNNVRGTARWILATGVPLWLRALLEFNRGLEPFEAPDLAELGGAVTVAALSTGELGLFIGLLTGGVLAWLVDQPRHWEEDAEED